MEGLLNNLNKDSSIKHILEVIFKRFKNKNLIIEDHWESDLCAIGIRFKDYFIYISTFSDLSNDFYDIDLEFIVKEGENIVIKRIRKVNENDLIQELILFLNSNNKSKFREEISIDKLYEYFLDTFSHCNISDLEGSDKNLSYQLFEEFDISCHSFLHLDNLNKLLKNGFINNDIKALSNELRNIMLTIQREGKWSLKFVRNDQNWSNLFQLSEKVKSIIHNNEEKTSKPNASYEKVSSSLTGNFIRYENTNELDLKNIKRGVLFLFAVWSPTLVFFQLLIQELKKLNVKDINIYILNIDGIPESFYEQELKSRSHGKGETFWIKNGEIIGKLLNYGEGYEDKVKIFTKKIIDG